MKQGDKIHIKTASYPHETLPDEHEVIEDTGTSIKARNCISQEVSEVPYYQVITGLFRCAYCGRPRHENELKSGEIIFRTRVRGRATIGRETKKYCADKPCHSYDQMAHEG